MLTPCTRTAFYSVFLASGARFNSFLRLDELIVKTKRLFEQKGMAGSIALLLRLVEEHIWRALLYGRPLRRPKPLL